MAGTARSPAESRVPRLLLVLPVLVLAALGLASTATGGDTSKAARRLLDDDDPAARAAAVRRLGSLLGGQLGGPSSGPPDSSARALVVAALSDSHPYVRGAAAGVLGSILDSRAR